MLTQEEQKNIERVEAEVCRLFGVDQDELKGKNKKSALNFARHFSIFILHNNYGLSSQKLSKHYNRCLRAIKYVSANMRGFLQYDKEIRAKLESVLEVLN